MSHVPDNPLEQYKSSLILVSFIRFSAPIHLHFCCWRGEFNFSVSPEFLYNTISFHRSSGRVGVWYLFLPPGPWICQWPSSCYLWMNINAKWDVDFTGRGTKQNKTKQQKDWKIRREEESQRALWKGYCWSFQRKGTGGSGTAYGQVIVWVIFCLRIKWHL